jgi:hypothetical protein
MAAIAMVTKLQNCHQIQKFSDLGEIWFPSRSRHSKPTMNINSQHHNLLGNQISPESGGFLYSAAILYLAYHGKN